MGDATSWRWTGCAALMLLGACDSSPGEETLDAGALPAPTVARGSDAPTEPVPRTTDPAALEELVAAAPTGALPSTGPDGATRVGTDTGEPEENDGPEPITPQEAGAVRVHAGEAELRPPLSSPALERAARAQLYWRLRDCRVDGEPPPPESITLGFTIRHDGSVDPASVTADADSEALAEVALCVLRIFSASPFVGPAAGRGSSSRVLITWPSVD